MKSTFLVSPSLSLSQKTMVSLAASDHRVRTIVKVFDEFWERQTLLTPLVPKDALPSFYPFTFQPPFSVDYDTMTQPCSVCFARKETDQLYPGFMIQYIPDGSSELKACIGKEVKIPEGNRNDGIGYTLLPKNMRTVGPQLFPSVDLGCMCSTKCAATVLMAIQSYLVLKYGEQLLMPPLSLEAYETMMNKDLGSVAPETQTKEKEEKKVFIYFYQRRGDI